MFFLFLSLTAVFVIRDRIVKKMLLFFVFFLKSRLVLKSLSLSNKISSYFSCSGQSMLSRLVLVLLRLGPPDMRPPGPSGGLHDGLPATREDGAPPDVAQPVEALLQQAPQGLLGGVRRPVREGEEETTLQQRPSPAGHHRHVRLGLPHGSVP